MLAHTGRRPGLQHLRPGSPRPARSKVRLGHRNGTHAAACTSCSLPERSCVQLLAGLPVNAQLSSTPPGATPAAASGACSSSRSSSSSPSAFGACLPPSSSSPSRTPEEAWLCAAAGGDDGGSGGSAGSGGSSGGSGGSGSSSGGGEDEDGEEYLDLTQASRAACECHHFAAWPASVCAIHACLAVLAAPSSHARCPASSPRPQAEELAAAKGLSLPDDFAAAASAGGLRRATLDGYLRLASGGWLTSMLVKSVPAFRDRLIADRMFFFKVWAEVAIDSGG